MHYFASMSKVSCVSHGIGNFGLKNLPEERNFSFDGYFANSRTRLAKASKPPPNRIRIAGSGNLTIGVITK